MGMDYKYCGSASYPRFNNELKGIVELFGGKVITNRKPQNECTMVEYFMEEPLKYEMPEGTPEVFVNWINNPYKHLCYTKVKKIYTFMEPKIDEARDISYQIIGELESCIACKDSWDIS